MFNLCGREGERERGREGERERGREGERERGREGERERDLLVGTKDLSDSLLYIEKIMKKQTLSYFKETNFFPICHRS